MLAINWSIPSFANVCIDECSNGEVAGRFYHQYDKKPVHFTCFMELLRQMDDLFESIHYPQATARQRSFLKEQAQAAVQQELTPVWQSREFGGERGMRATFYIMVKGRANASWQGDVVWVEREIKKTFRSAMELMVLMDNATK